MAVFRADDDPDYEEESAVDESEDDDDLYYQSDTGDSNQAERSQLDGQRQQFDQNSLPYVGSDSSNKERQALDEVDGRKASSAYSFAKEKLTGRSSAGRQSKNNSSSKKSLLKNKKVLAGVGMFFLPTMVGLILVLIALQAGLTLEHISRVTTGLRFGSMHLMLSRRFNHVRREYVRLADYQTPNSNRSARYVKTTLGSRLLGVTPDKIYRHLENTRGYKFEYSTFKDGPLIAKGRKTLTRVTYPDGTVKDIKSSSDALDFVRASRLSFDDLEISRFRANRASFLMAKQIGIPFLRFRALIDGLKDGSLKNSIRGSPARFVQQRVNEEILVKKQRLVDKLPRLKENLERFDVDELADTARVDANKNLGKKAIDSNIKKSLDARQAVLKTTSAASITVAVVTLACVIREIGSMIRDAFKMKVRGLQDSAATLITTTSQIKAGDMSGEVVGDMTRRFEGFATSANYQVVLGDQPASDFVSLEGSDFSQELSPAEVFDGWAVAPLLKFSDLLSPAKFLAATTAYVKSHVSFLGGLVGKITALLGDEISKAVNVIEDQFKKACKTILNVGVQFGILAFEVLASITALIFSGGLAAGAKVGAGQVVKQVTKIVARTVAVDVAAGIALDILLFDHLLPGVVKNATGLDTALISGTDASDGAENYAKVDYGMHYLSTGEALGSGGSRLPTQEAVVQTQTYLAQQRTEYANEGLISNLFSFDNPYSLTSSLIVAQNTGGSWQQKGQTYVAGLLGNLSSNLDFSQPVYAQESDQQALQRILYPDQDTVIGFHEAEMNGSDKLFAHEANTIYVENNIEYLKNEYSMCLGVETAEFLLSQIVTNSNEYGYEYYPEKCDQAEARRYKTYYQDCTLIESIRLWGTDSSPMFSSHCDHLLSVPDQDTLNEPLGFYHDNTTAQINLDSYIVDTSEKAKPGADLAQNLNEPEFLDAPTNDQKGYFQKLTAFLNFNFA